MNEHSIDDWLKTQDFQSFKACWPLQGDSVWKSLHHINSDKISIQRRDLAARKLKLIFEAAFALVQEKGFYATTLRDLSARTGMSMGSLYSYIGSKEDIALMVTRVLSNILQLILELIPASLTPSQRLNLLVRAHLFASELLQPWFYFVYMEVKGFDSESRKLAMAQEYKLESVIREILQQGQQTGEFASSIPELMPSHIAAVLQDWHLKRWKYNRMNVRVEAYAESVARQVFSALGANRD